MAAADPVFLETTRNNLRVHALADDDVDSAELGSLLNTLQESLAGNNQTTAHQDSVAFARLGAYAYLRSDEALATAAVSADMAGGHDVSDYLPQGEGSEQYHRLLSELQMVLHEHDVNRAREEAGQRPVNSLWIWGGGVAPQKGVRPIPPLFSEEPLFRGYWESCTGVYDSWNGNFASCLEVAVSGFVVVTTGLHNASTHDVLEDYLCQLHKHMKSGDISSLTLLFRDGLCVEIGRLDFLKFWRRQSTLLTSMLNQ